MNEAVTGKSLDKLKQLEQSYYSLCDALFNELPTGVSLLINSSGEQSQFIRLNQGRIRQTGLVQDGNLRLELFQDGKKCSGSFNFTGLDEQDLRSARRILGELSREIQEIPEDPFAVFPLAGEHSSENHVGRGLPPAAAPQEITGPLKDLDLAGIYAAGYLFRASASSNGGRHWYGSEHFSLDYSLINPDDKMVKGSYAGNRWESAEYRGSIEHSRTLLGSMEAPAREITPGEYRVYLAPAAVADIIGMLSWEGLSEGAIRRGKSALGLMRSKDVLLSPHFNLSEDFSAGLSPRFNDEGERRAEKLELIKNGRLENALINSRTAKEYSLKSNQASAHEGQSAAFMAPGDLTEIEILPRLDKGLYIMNLHYLNWSDRIHGRITGMTRYACFHVEGGKIQGPIENMRFDDSIYRILGSELEAVGDRIELIPDVATYDARQVGGLQVPGILLKSFALTL